MNKILKKEKIDRMSYNSGFFNGFFFGIVYTVIALFVISWAF